MHWDVSPEIFSFGPITIRWYGLLFAAGFMAGFYMMQGIYRRERYDPRHLDTLLLYMVLGTLVGARLGHCLFYEPDVYLRDPLRILKVWEGGLASHGGTVGAVASVWLFTRKYGGGPPFLALVDLLAVPTALASALIRVGNFFNSEILGTPSKVPWAVRFVRVDDIPRHPAQLYEALSYLALFLVLLLLYGKRLHRGRPGIFIGLLLVWVYSARFLIEFVKEPQVAFETNLAVDLGQLLSVPFVLVGFYLMVRGWQAQKVE